MTTGIPILVIKTMAIYIALMRGINVSGRHLIRMAELQNSFAALGFADVQTYLQSGNVVFRSGKSDASTLASVIENKVKQDFGHDVAVLVLTAGQLAAIAAANPLWPQAGGDEKQFHCTFLFEPASTEKYRMLKLPAEDGIMGSLRLRKAQHITHMPVVVLDMGNIA